jgi:hypothetical protein
VPIVQSRWYREREVLRKLKTGGKWHLLGDVAQGTGINEDRPFRSLYDSGECNDKPGWYIAHRTGWIVPRLESSEAAVCLMSSSPDPTTWKQCVFYQTIFDLVFKCCFCCTPGGPWTLGQQADHRADLSFGSSWLNVGGNNTRACRRCYGPILACVPVSIPSAWSANAKRMFGWRVWKEPKDATAPACIGGLDIQYQTASTSTVVTRDDANLRRIPHCLWR